MFQNNLLMGAASISAGGITVDNSVRFNDDDSPRLTRTPTTVGNRRRGSLSLWYKRCNLGSVMQLFNAGAGDDITFNASDKLTFTDSSGVSYITTQVFRDTTAWGHLVFAWDTTLETAGDRLRIYHNGAEITAFDTETNPSQNDEFEISNTVLQTIGANESGTEEFDGYLSQVYYIDGQQLTPTDFGETDDNGVWRPIEYTAGSVGSAVTVALTDNSSDASDTTAYTFSSQSLGAAAANRKIVVGIVNYDDSPGTAASSVTVGGVTADRVQAMIGAGATMSTEIWQADVPTGTTGDVVVTWAAAVKSCGIGVWRVIGANSRPYGSKTTTADPGVVSMNIPAGGIGIGMSATGSGAGVTWTWTNLTEDFEDSITSGARSQWSGASAAFASAQSGLSITANASAAADNTFVCSIWGPTDTTYGTNGFKLDFSNSTLLGLDVAGAAASSTTYRYLKLDVTDNGASTTYVSLAEMQYYVGATLYPTQTMTSNTLPSPLVASASEDTGTGAGLAYLAFDDNINSHWQTANGTVTGWLKIDLGSGNGIAPDSFRLGAPETPDRTPNGFTIQGSNNDSDWTILATYAGFSTPTPTARTYSGYAPITTGNNFVSSGLATNDQVPDTPTKNYCVFNAINKSSTFTLSDGNLTSTQSATSSRNSVGSTMYVGPTGKYYFEITCVTNANEIQIGVGGTIMDITSTAADQADVWWYRASGEIYGNGTEGSSGDYSTFTNGDVIQVAVDMDASKIWFGKNGTFVGDPAAGSGEAFSTLPDYVTPVSNAYLAGVTTLTCGQVSFAHSAPTGFKEINTANLPTPTIPDGTAYFQTTLYTGNGSSRNIDQIENSTFQPDMVWIKNRSQDDSHMLIDAARGVTKELNPDSYIPQSTDSNGLTSFDSDGFGLGSGAGGYNDNTESFVAWQWLAGGGAGSSNEDGSINTITTTSNATSGIAVGTYTGTGSAGTIGHGLGAAPEFVVCKEASDDGVGGQWFVYHQDQNATPEDFYLIWDEAQRAVDNSEMWNDTAPTSTVFSIGNNNDINASGSTYFYLALVGIEGYSKFGSYTGNAAADGPFIYTGFKPEFVVVKAIVDSEGWVMKSATINPYNIVTKNFMIDTNAAEASSDDMDFLSNGFKIRTTNSDSNKSATTIVYMAFAEYPFGGEDVTPSTTF